MDVSIVIVNWNTSQITCDCLKSVYRQIGNINFEVIVVDNASTDDSVEVIKNEFPQVNIIQNPVNLGFAAANNQGITRAKGRYVLLLNSDTVVLDNAISKTVSFADDNPEAAVVACKVLNPDKTLQTTCFMFPSILNMLLSSTYLYKIFPKSRFFGRERMTWWDRSNSRQVDVATGCFMLVRQDAIQQVGTMDEQFFMYGEETDWCYRFKQAGWKVMFTPVGEIMHLGGQSSRQNRTQMILKLRGSMLLFFQKYNSKFSYRLACLLICLFFSCRVPYWLGKALFSKDATNRHLQRAKTYATGAFRALHGWRGLCLER